MLLQPLMKQVLLLIYAGTDTHEGMARVTNALTMAKELDEHGHDVDIAFDGAAVQWIEELESGHQLSEIYEEVKHNITSACDFCANAFDADVDDDIREGSYEGHQSFNDYVEEDWKIITF